MRLGYYCDIFGVLLYIISSPSQLSFCSHSFALRALLVSCACADMFARTFRCISFLQRVPCALSVLSVWNDAACVILCNTWCLSTDGTRDEKIGRERLTASPLCSSAILFHYYCTSDHPVITFDATNVHSFARILAVRRG